jgi:hypothetical protein
MHWRVGEDVSQLCCLDPLGFASGSQQYEAALILDTKKQNTKKQYEVV